MPSTTSDAWLLELQRDVEEARATGGKTAFAYPERPEGIPDSPHYVSYHVFETEAWTTAKESSQLVLLPRAEAEIYARVYIQSDQVTQTRERARELGMRQGAFETRFSHGTYPPDMSHAQMTLTGSERVRRDVGRRVGGGCGLRAYG